MNLLNSLAKISLITILSRILGFVRDVLVAQYFGAGMATDAFFVAFKLPNFLRRIFAEGALSQAFVPILSEYKNQRGKKETLNLIAHVSGMLMLILGVVSILGVLGAPLVIYVTAPGFLCNPDKFELTYILLRITFPYIFFISLASLAAAILTTWDLFLVPAFAPIFLNISIIIFSLFGASYFHPPIIALAWAVILGGLLQLSYQLPTLRKIGTLVLPCINLHNKGLWRVIKLMGPAIIGVSVSQISLIINTIFASFLMSGSVSWMYYADRLIEFPSGVLGVTLGTLLLPYLAKSISRGCYKDYSYLIDWGLRLCFLLAIPSSIALGILSKPLIMALFQYGNFTTFDTDMTQRALIPYTIGLVGLILVKVLAPSFYSCQKIKIPVQIAIITIIITQLMNIAFIWKLQHAGLSLSIGLAAYLNASLLYWQLRKKNMYIPQPGWRIFLLKLLAAAIIMTIVLIGLMSFITAWDSGNMLIRLLRLMAVVLVGAGSYFSALALLGIRISDFNRKLSNQ
ncbi:murein biosynthesis integral membrane protein MurJ [Candidatus Profftia tarda]|uniref:Probable lipid II flippase MurJ n=1 Tax=Candidatus Profftia tarda TaxID=1177216 RepID=A0A8E4EZV7_9ENTR|nr:murein biosynthesis integral membrane protein MurJ [Candidatus Profftia tarda]CAD6508833.1 Protein MurJ homolog [Candidatus Profftia tarda]